MIFKARIIPLFFVAALSFIGCTAIDKDNRLIPYEYEVPDGEHIVLVEDYTGQKCNNCPVFATGLSEFVAQVPEGRIITVAIHDKNLLSKRGSTFPTPSGTEYTKALGISYVPIGVVDRQTNESGATALYNLSARGDFESAITAALGLPQQMGLNAVASFEADRSKVHFEVTATRNEHTKVADENLMIQAWLIENGVVASQTMPNNTENEEYVHNHLLRAALNGDWGEAISPGVIYKHTADIPVEGAGAVENKDNLKLILFVYDKTTKNIIESIEIPIN